MNNLMDVKTMDLMNELGRRNMSITSMALTRQPVDTLEDYRQLKSAADMYARLFARKTLDSKERGVRVALFFRAYDMACKKDEKDEMARIKENLDDEFAVMFH